MLNFNAALRDRRALDITGSQLHTVHGQPPTKLPCDACAARRRRTTAVAAFWRSERTCVPSGVGAAAAAAGALELQPPCCSVATPLDSALRNCECCPPGCCSAMELHERPRGASAAVSLANWSPGACHAPIHAPLLTPLQLLQRPSCVQKGPYGSAASTWRPHQSGGGSLERMRWRSGCLCPPSIASQEQSAAQG